MPPVDESVYVCVFLPSENVWGLRYLQFWANGVLVLPIVYITLHSKNHLKAQRVFLELWCWTTFLEPPKAFQLLFCTLPCWLLTQKSWILRHPPLSSHSSPLTSSQLSVTMAALSWRLLRRKPPRHWMHWRQILPENLVLPPSIIPNSAIARHSLSAPCPNASVRIIFFSQRVCAPIRKNTRCHQTWQWRIPPQIRSMISPISGIAPAMGFVAAPRSWMVPSNELPLCQTNSLSEL